MYYIFYVKFKFIKNIKYLYSEIINYIILLGSSFKKEKDKEVSGIREL